MLTLKAPFAVPVQTIVLPSASLSNTLASDDRQQLHQALDGTMYTYVRTNEYTILDVSLTNVTRDILDSLVSMIQDYGDVTWEITDHASRVWEARLNITPVSMQMIGRDGDDTVPCFETGDLSLQFIGILQP